jgi:hypothetical protein
MAEHVSAPRFSASDESRLIEMLASMRVEPYWQPGNSKRLTKAEQLYREGSVVPSDDGFFEVRGSDEESYTVGRVCPCAYSQAREDRWCSHRIAAALYRKLHFMGSREESQHPSFEELMHDTHAVAAEEHHMSPTALETPGSPQDPFTSPQVSAAVAEQKVPLAAMTTPENTISPLAPLLRSPALPPSLPPRTYLAILADLSRPLPDECLDIIPEYTSPKTQKTRPAQDFLHWHTVTAVLDTYAPGWEGEIVRIEKIAGDIVVVYRLTIHASDKSVSQDGDGMEAETKDDYGDAMTSAVATALKRAASKHGVGRQQMYDKKGKTAAFLASVRKEKEGALKELASVADAKGVPRKAILAWLCRQAGVFRASDLPTYLVKSMARQLEGQPDAALAQGGNGTPPMTPTAPVSLETLDEESEHIDLETGEIVEAWARGQRTAEKREAR